MSGPFLRYAGSKWRLADWICDHLPAHDQYLEPFLGSGAIFFNKTPAAVETINDIDGEVINLFRMVREQPHALALAVSLTPYARGEQELSWEPTPGGDPVERARRYLTRVWLNHGMDSYAHGGFARTRAVGGHGNSSRVPVWNQVPARIMGAIERLKDAQIEQRPAISLIAEHADPGCLIYADPPYMPRSRTHGRLYAHEMLAADHVELLTALLNHPGPVVLSGYASNLYDDALASWTRLQTAGFADTAVKRTEVLWLNPTTTRRLERGRAQTNLAALMGAQ